MSSTDFVFLFKTKGNANPKDKPKIYFTCHPDDFTLSFEKICSDIFASHDCAIYYTEDMTMEIPEDNRETDLERMNLFVIPVTYRLLTKPNRAMDSDFRFAMTKHIPVLPIMMEGGIDAYYSMPDKFGTIQYLNPYSMDITEIRYVDKLKKYLEAVLISDETIRRVRAAFDAYIFLSYRKKDRRLANDLMRLIHSKQELRDIAVWYDEFLTPGESFKDNIDRMLHDSKLFTLLVTPNLLEEPNYIMSTEYPAAIESGLPILPTEMPETIEHEETDKRILTEKYQGITRCCPADEDFLQQLLEVLTKHAKKENDDDPVHNYLIGLAYLEGIDVEKNTERGVQLITSAGEAELPEAIEKLYIMYYQGIAVRLDWAQAEYWAEKLVDVNRKMYGEGHKETMGALNILAQTFRSAGAYKKALDVFKQVYGLACKYFGEEDPTSLTFQGNLASVYGDLGDYKKELALQEQNYSLCCKVLGEEHPDTLTALNNIAVSYGYQGLFLKASEFFEKIYLLDCKLLGENHPDTLIDLINLAQSYDELGDRERALSLQKEAYASCCSTLGNEHPQTLIALCNLACTYGGLGDYNMAAKLEEKAYEMRSKVLGKEHPDSQVVLNNLAQTYCDLGTPQKAIELEESIYTYFCMTLGEEHPDSITVLGNIARVYSEIGDQKKAIDILSKVYNLKCKVLGVEHPNTLITLSNLAVVYYEIGDYSKAQELGEKAYSLSCRVLGEEHPQALTIMTCLAETYRERKDHIKALKMKEKAYNLCRKVLGEEHPDSLIALDSLVISYVATDNTSKALEFQEKSYALRCKALGEEHPDTLTSLYSLALLYVLCGKIQKAFKGLVRYNKTKRLVHKKEKQLSKL